MDKGDNEMNRNPTTLITAIEDDYLPHLVRNYATWTTPDPATNTRPCDVGRRINEFRLGLTFKKGRNYVKIITQSGSGNKSVHSFIVLKPTKGFEIGTILKAASWVAPATNFGRGNVFDKPFKRVTWTGAL